MCKCNVAAVGIMNLTKQLAQKMQQLDDRIGNIREHIRTLEKAVYTAHDQQSRFKCCNDANKQLSEQIGALEAEIKKLTSTKAKRCKPTTKS